ncbi:MAG TPA: N-acetylglucosamine-6-phosphate deacetylase [Acetobacteraceae bacterium]
MTGFRPISTVPRMQAQGLFDLQVNGYAGIDFNSADITPDGVDHALESMWRSGVTQCLPTIITAPAGILAERLAALDRAVAISRFGGAMVPGYHLEGPFLSPEDGFAGCHPASAMQAPDPALVQRLEAPLRRPILLLTLAPERDGAVELIRWARQRGKVVALGHTAASAAQVTAAADAGASLSTHLGNGLRGLLPKFANPLLAQLGEDRLWASFIADGIHVPPPALKVMLRAKSLERSILVTDATAAAAAPAGRYEFAGMAIEHAADGSVRVPGGTMLAGSSLRLDQAVRNLAAWGLAPAAMALRLAAGNPAALMAPALAAYGVCLQRRSVAWSDTLIPRITGLPA